MTHSGESMQFRSERPLNALPTVRWELEGQGGVEHASGSAVCRQGDTAEWKISHSNIWNAKSHFTMVVKWDNVNGASTTNLKLSRY